ncbi:MAG: hypothetical protein HQK94_09170 [Nitrospirae bacterium]|nr:hypothetical protein [Nitrospirota bacterium]
MEQNRLTIDVSNHIADDEFDETGESSSTIESNIEGSAAESFSANLPDAGKIELLSNIKRFDLLKDDIGASDIGRTIKDMFSSIKSMEKQLSSVLAINAALEKDNKASKEAVAGLREEKRQLEIIIENMQDELPSKKEFRAEIDHLIEERNASQASIKEMKAFVDKSKGEITGYKMRITELENEKSDLLKDIQYLEAKISKALEKLNAYGKEIHILTGERLSNLEKLKNLQIQFKECLDERNKVLDQTLE